MMIVSYTLEHEEQIPQMVKQIINRAPYTGDSSKGNEELICRLDSPGVSGIFKDLNIAPGLNITLLDIKTRVPFHFEMECSVPSMAELGFTLKGHVGYNINSLRHELDNYAGQGHLCVCRGDMECRISMPADEHFFMMEAQFDMERFIAFCDRGNHNLPECLRTGEKDKSQFISKCTTMTPETLRPLVIEMAREGLSSSCDKFKLEEICSNLTVEMIKRLSGNIGKGKTILSSRDIERIREARFILEQEMAAPPTLMELSRRVGLNDYKLKRGFRQAYGTTVHRTLTELRMNHARRLLEDRDITVSDAALQVGYGNIGDFGQAFKLRFGILPSHIPSRRPERMKTAS